jgi:hypothetical protein
MTLQRMGILLLLVATLCLTTGGARGNRQDPGDQNVALRHLSGFEVGSVEWDGLLSGGTIDTTIVRTGTQSYRAAANSATLTSSLAQDLGGITEVYFRFYIYVETMPSSSVNVFRIKDSGSGNNACIISISNSGEVFLSPRFGTAIQIGTITAGGWHRVEGHVVTDPVTGVIEGRFDGGTIVSGTGRDTGSGLSSYDIGVINNVNGGVFYFDDFRLNDTTGSLNNSWPGEGECYSLRPNSDASPNAWTSSAGGSHFEDVNDNSTTEYIVTTSNTLNLEDRWGVENLSNLVAVQSTINGMMAGAFGEGFGAGGSRDTKLRFRDGSGNTKDGITFTWVPGFSVMIYPHTTAESTWEASPVPLTVDYVDAMFMSALDANTNTREIRWYGAWLTVEVVEPKVIMQALAGGVMGPILPE